jgi:hypothetical protein
MKLTLNESEAKELSTELRSDHSAHMRNRRAIAALSLLAAAPLGVVALWQLGIIRKLPEPPLKSFDAAKVNGAPQAYDKFAMPDAILGIGSLAATMALAGMGGPRRARLLTLAMAGKVVLDTLVAGKLTLDQARKYHAFCAYCLLSASATAAMVPFAVAEL